MKITLISPYSSIESFGLATLSSCLRKAGHDVKFVFLLNEFTEKYKEHVLDEIAEISSESQLIGITLITNYFDNAVQITNRLKQDSSTPVVWGGIHPTIRPDECLDYADIICLGEGEIPIVELADRIEKKLDYSEIKGMWFKKDGEIIKNEIRPLIQEVDSIPPPDYNYGGNYYILDNDHVETMTLEHFKQYFPVYRTIATRGCPYSCSYCCNNTLNKLYSGEKIIRKRSPANVVSELEEVKNRFSFIERIEFNDDAFFTYTMKELGELFDAYGSKIKLPFTVFAGQPRAVNKEKIEFCVNAGMDKIRIGIQSASEKSRILYNRPCSNDDILKAVNIIHEFKDRVEPLRFDIILDNPWEEETDLVETLMFLSKLPKPFYLYLYSLTFYPETELCELAKSRGLVKDELNDVYRKQFLGIKDGYLNNIFKLLNEIYPWGGRIPPWQMFMLTNTKFRKLKLNYPALVLIKIKSFLLKIQWLQNARRKIFNDQTRYFKR